MKKYNKASLTFLAILTLPILSIAETTTVVATKPESNFWYNPLVLSLVGLMLILLYAIAVLTNAIRNLGFAHRDKIREERQNGTITKSLLLLVGVTAISKYSLAEEVAQKAAKVDAGIGGISTSQFYVLVSIIAFEMLVLVVLLYVMKMLVHGLSNMPDKEIRTAKLKARISFWDKFNKAVAIEKETDIMLDHDYDGIKELDNSLPPWWKYGFYLTILVACVYIYRFHISHDGKNSIEEYAAEVQKAKEQQAAYLANAANNVDESNVVLLADAASLEEGKKVFQTVCAACHLKDGGGSVGPNLTDEYWLHGGSIKDVFKSIKYGWQDKGMKSWKDDFSPKQIQQIASYVKSLKGTHPATPKDKQGELYIESGQQPATDSTKKTEKAVVAN